MCHWDTRSFARLCGSMLIAWGAALAQVPAANAPVAQQPEWRKIGNLAMERMLASPASGPVAEVWFSARCQSCMPEQPPARSFATVDFENWSRWPSLRALRPFLDADPPPGSRRRGAAHPTDSANCSPGRASVSIRRRRPNLDQSPASTTSPSWPNQHDIAVSPAIPSKWCWLTTPGCGDRRRRPLLDRPEPVPAQPARREAGGRPANGRGMRIK